MVCFSLYHYDKPRTVGCFTTITKTSGCAIKALWNTTLGIQIIICCKLILYEHGKNVDNDCVMNYQSGNTSRYIEVQIFYKFPMPNKQVKLKLGTY